MEDSNRVTPATAPTWPEFADDLAACTWARDPARYAKLNAVVVRIAAFDKPLAIEVESAATSLAVAAMEHGTAHGVNVGLSANTPRPPCWLVALLHSVSE